VKERRSGMLKKSGFWLLCLAVMVSFFFIAQAWTEEQGWKKTITLPSGEVVCDLNGEWAYLWQGRGSDQATFGRIRDVVKITQQGDSFEGIRMIGNFANPKGQIVIEGKLDNSGCKKLNYNVQPWSGEYKAKISKDGNKIEFESNNFYIELTRK
jgi:hypothetical protein